MVKAGKKGKARKKKTPGVDAFLRAGAAAYFLLLPFVFSNYGLDTLRLPKDLFTVFAASALGAAFLITRRLAWRFRPASWEFLLAAAVAYAFVHSLFSIDPAASLRALAFAAFWVALFFVLRAIWTQEFIQKLWLGLAAAGAIHSLLAILQFYGMIESMVDAEGRLIQGRATPAGLIGEVNSGAMFFGLCALMMLFWITHPKKPWQRTLAACLLALNLAGLAYTRTLTALAAFAAGLLLWLVYFHWRRFRAGGPATGTIKALWGAMAAGLVLALLVAWQSALIERVQTVAEQMRQGDWSVATSGRQPIYRLTWEMIKEDPVRGRGMGTFPREFFQQRVGTEVGREADLADQPGALQEVHNEYLQAWLELGLPGLLLFLALALIPLARAVEDALAEADERMASWWALCAIAAVFFLIEALAFFPLQAPVSAAAVVLVYSGLRARQNPRRAELDPAPLSGRGLLKAALAAGLAVAAAYPYFQQWKANTLLGTAQEILRTAGSPQAPPRRRSVALRHSLGLLDQAVQLCPSCWKAYDLQGTAYFFSGRRHLALESYQTAASHQPTPEVYTNLATVHMASGRLDEAREALETALAYRPRYVKAQQAMRQLRQEQSP